MPRTVTVSVSVLVAVALVLAGVTTYVVAAQEPAPPDPDVESFALWPVDDHDGRVVDVSALPRVQRAVVLLAVDPGERGAYATTDDRERAAIESLPAAVRYDGQVYEVTETTGHADTVPLPLREWAGIALAALGTLAFVGARFARAARND